ncbi:TPA: hypothetical protein HA234_00390 [Candidatus Woesearchaeota archaeon]|nr:hypothetical protein [Candidatus Woesearchaeota archaeon]
MSLASKTYFRFAQEAEESMNKEPDHMKKKEYRKVAAQNYFYSAMEAIESVLKKAGIDLYSINSHEERLALVKKNNALFRDPMQLILKFEIMINYDYRRKVAYKGENGNKFIIVKEFAMLCQHEIA